MKESLRYLHNARNLLKKAPREGRRYSDVKPVQESCGTAYLAVLKAIDEYLLKSGITEKELPQSVDAYRQMLRKYLAVHNGKLFNQFNDLYDELHIAGYYRGLLHDVKGLKNLFDSAQEFIAKLSR